MGVLPQLFFINFLRLNFSVVGGTHNDGVTGVKEFLILKSKANASEKKYFGLKGLQPILKMYRLRQAQADSFFLKLETPLKFTDI